MRIMAFLFALAIASAASADDAARDWSQSMGYSSPSTVANNFNAALAAYNLKQNGSGAAGGGGGGGGSSTVICKTEGACTLGGSATQWNGVSIITVTDSKDVTINNQIDADSDQDARSTVINGCCEAALP